MVVLNVTLFLFQNFMLIFRFVSADNDIVTRIDQRLNDLEEKLKQLEFILIKCQCGRVSATIHGTTNLLNVTTEGSTLTEVVKENLLNATTESSLLNETTNEALINATAHASSMQTDSIKLESRFIPETANSCPLGWMQFNNSCWHYDDQALNWASAQYRCRDKGGNLVSIHSEEENMYASNLRTAKFNDDLSLVKINECQNAYHNIFLLVDGSGSIGDSEFPKIKSFLKQIVDTTVMGPEKSQFSVVQFSDYQWTEIGLNHYQSNQAVKEAIDGIPYRQGGTLIGQAIEYLLKDQLNPVIMGARAAYPSYVIILTDGYSQDNATNSAQLLRSVGVTVLVIGVTDAVSYDQLKNIAGNANRVFLINDFDSLNKELTSVLHTRICSTTGAWIGLNLQVNNNEHSWSDDTRLDFVNWEDDQNRNKSCAIMNNSPQAKWNKVNCHTLRPFLCRTSMNDLPEIVPNKPLLIVVDD